MKFQLMTGLLVLTVAVPAFAGKEIADTQSLPVDRSVYFKNFEPIDEKKFEKEVMHELYHDVDKDLKDPEELQAERDYKSLAARLPGDHNKRFSWFNVDRLLNDREGDFAKLRDCKWEKIDQCLDSRAGYCTLNIKNFKSMEDLPDGTISISQQERSNGRMYKRASVKIKGRVWYGKGLYVRPNYITETDRSKEDVPGFYVACDRLSSHDLD